MEKYVYLDNHEDILKMNSIKKRIGTGTEGDAYLTADNKVLKIHNGYEPTIIKDEDKEKIIMAQDYKVQSFLFPEKIFIYNGVVYGYLTPYMKNIIKYDLDSSSDIPFLGFNSIKSINLDNLLAAREKMIEDTRIISKDNIIIYDLCFNLLFDGQKLGAIDTLRYYKDSEPTFDANVKRIDYSILNELHFHDLSFEPDLDDSLENNFKRIRKI